VWALATQVMDAAGAGAGGRELVAPAPSPSPAPAQSGEGGAGGAPAPPPCAAAPLALLDAPPFSGAGAAHRAAAVRRGLLAVPLSGELWVEAARVFLLRARVGGAEGARARDGARACLRVSAACTSQCGDVFSECARLGAAEGGGGAGAITALAVAANPNYGPQWVAFQAWPAWEGRDRAVDVMARVERALATGGRDAAGGRGELPSPAQLLGKLRGERALKRLHVLFGGDALSA